MQGWKTFIGLLITLAGVLMQQLGVIDATTAASLQGDATTIADRLAGWIDTAIAIAGLIVAFYGRLKAETRMFGKDPL